MPPTTKIGGGVWSCGARAKHHHRKRLRDPEFLTIRTTTYGVASSSCCASQRRQRQQLAPRASTWRCKGAKQKTLAPREGQALEERSSSSRSTSWTRTRGQHLPYVRRRERQQLAPRASTWRCKGAKQTALAPREGQALEERSSSSRSPSRPRTRGRQLPCVRRRQRQQLAPRASKWRLGGAKQKQPEGWRKEGLIALGEDLAQRTAALTRDVHLSCVTTTTTAAARAPTSGARSKRVRWPRARRSPKPGRPLGGSAQLNMRANSDRRASPRRQRRTSTSLRRRRQLALEERGGARARGARPVPTENKELRRQLERAAANQGGHYA